LCFIQGAQLIQHFKLASAKEITPLMGRRRLGKNVAHPHATEIRETIIKAKEVKLSLYLSTTP
jgi:hypothetical protein